MYCWCVWNLQGYTRAVPFMDHHRSTAQKVTSLLLCIKRAVQTVCIVVLHREYGINNLIEFCCTQMHFPNIHSKASPEGYSMTTQIFPRQTPSFSDNQQHCAVLTCDCQEQPGVCGLLYNSFMLISFHRQR